MQTGAHARIDALPPIYFGHGLTNPHVDFIIIIISCSFLFFIGLFNLFVLIVLEKCSITQMLYHVFLHSFATTSLLYVAVSTADNALSRSWQCFKLELFNSGSTKGCFKCRIVQSLLPLILRIDAVQVNVVY